MESTPSPTTNNPSDAPQPEALQPLNDAAVAVSTTPSPAASQAPKPPRHHSYRPSHRATLIGLAAVAVILIFNALVLGVVLKKQSKNEDLLKGQVAISSADLNRLGVNRSPIGDSGIQLLVTPDATFKGKLSVAGATNISGQVVLNSKLTGTDASLAQLQAGDTSLSKLNVNGEGTLSSLVLRKDLVVNGQTRLQGPITLSQLLTINNSVNVAGNLSVGGTLNVNTFSAQSIIVRSHLLTSGAAPTVARGPATGSNGSVSISGNDIAGTIAINIGAGASGGILVNLAFHSNYTGTPKVVISPIGIGGSFYITNLSVAGFSVGINSGLPPGGYRLDYIVAQ